MSILKVSKKGWIVIPKEIRERYGIRAGDRVHIVDYAGRIAIIPALKAPVRQSRGLLKGYPALTEALLEERQRERKREERALQRQDATEEGKVDRDAPRDLERRAKPRQARRHGSV